MILDPFVCPTCLHRRRIAERHELPPGEDEEREGLVCLDDEGEVLDRRDEPEPEPAPSPWTVVPDPWATQGPVPPPPF